jgi:hypothetical protein
MAERERPEARTMMYLLIGTEHDACCRLVAAALRERGHDAWMSSDPLAGEFAVVWSLDEGGVASRLRLPDGTTVPGERVRGMLVRHHGGAFEAEGWAADDLAYLRTEGQAAMLAWLWSLPCPVVNRPTDDLWFRPQRTVPEWRTLMRRHGLPTPAIRVTNDPAEARRFAARWGAVTYAPLTSATRYPIADAGQWAELDKVMARLPVCLVEPCAGPTTRAVVVGDEVVWGAPLARPGARLAIESGLRRLAATLRLAVLEAEVREGEDGPRCVGLDPYPRFERYEAPIQAALTAGVVGLLGGER